LSDIRLYTSPVIKLSSKKVVTSPAIQLLARKLPGHWPSQQILWELKVQQAEDQDNLSRFSICISMHNYDLQLSTGLESYLEL